GVGLARKPTDRYPWAFVFHPLLCFGEWWFWSAGRFEILHLGESEGQLVFVDVVRVSLLVHDDRKRLAPITLARKEPVAQLVLHGFVRHAVRFEHRRDVLLRLRGGHLVDDG